MTRKRFPSVFDVVADTPQADEICTNEDCVGPGDAFWQKAGSARLANLNGGP